MKNKKTVIIISHTNYLIKTGGTEKVIRTLEENLIDNNYYCINFFALDKIINSFGCNINGKFWGIFSQDNMENLIYTLSLKGYNFEKIIIGHLKGFDLRKLGSTIRNTNLKTILCIHDFYLVCNTFDFLKNKKDYCGLTRPTKKKCLDCYNYKKIKTFYRDRDYFFKSIDKNLVRIVFPSDFCKNKWLEFFPKYKSKAVVRNNLITTDVYQKNIKNKKLRIAYIGKKNIHKGIKIWNEIESNKKIINNFDLYYFGINTDNGNKNIKNIYVNNTKNNPYMMRDKLREYNIDIVILWSIIPETYSFTYYEASSAGCYILTNNKSGNISLQIKKNNNGKIFGKSNELINYLSNKLYQLEKNNFSPLNIFDNNSISDFEVEEASIINLNKKNKINKMFLMSIAYRVYQRLKK